MFNEAEEREALARILDQHDPEGGVWRDDIEGYPDLSWWYPQVDAILAAGFHRTPAPASDVQALIADARSRAESLRRMFPNDGETWDDARLVEHLADALEASQNGSCWDQGPTLTVPEGECRPMPPLCELRAGHLGAHKGGAAEWMTRQPVSTPHDITDDMVERAAKALWIEDQDDKFWAHSVVDDVFSPADDWPDDCIGYAIRARSALVSALGVSDA